MFANMMIAHVNVFGAWVDSQMPGKLNHVRDILKTYAVYAGLYIGNINLYSIFLDELNEGNDITKDHVP